MRARRRLRTALALLLALGALSPAAHAGPRQRTFDAPDQAMDAFIGALRTGDKKALAEILGPGSQSLLSSGDPVADRLTRERFVKEYDTAHRLAAGGGRIVLVVGQDDFPFPIPLIPAGPVWRFDTPAGKDEMLARRIGRNELNAIQVCLAVVDAQREYHGQDRNGDGVLEFAQRFTSPRGTRDGLHWDARSGEAPSPLGPLVARARTEGYRHRADGPPIPYHGYYFRMLTAQGPNAAGGAYSYMAGRHMIGGFAVVAFPAQYGNSGVMTFMTSHDGAVFQKDLGPETAALAGRIKAFDPDGSWQRVAP